jgi:hypothetical protein
MGFTTFMILLFLESMLLDYSVYISVCKFIVFVKFIDKNGLWGTLGVFVI